MCPTAMKHIATILCHDLVSPQRLPKKYWSEKSCELAKNGNDLKPDPLWTQPMFGFSQSLACKLIERENLVHRGWSCSEMWWKPSVGGLLYQSRGKERLQWLGIWQIWLSQLSLTAPQIRIRDMLDRPRTQSKAQASTLGMTILKVPDTSYVWCSSFSRLYINIFVHHVFKRDQIGPISSRKLTNLLATFLKVFHKASVQRHLWAERGNAQ